jgi:hypothetical protein
MNRRHFLKLSGLFAAAAMVAPEIIAKALSAAPEVVGVHIDIPLTSISVGYAQERLARTLMALGKYGFLVPDAETDARLTEMLDFPKREYDYGDRDLWKSNWGAA